MARESYPSDLNDKEWEILSARLPAKKDPRGRPRKQDLRELLNGIFYLLRTGCSWRMLPHDLPPWQTIYSQFRAWKRQGYWEDVHRTLREFVRIGMGREPNPSALIIDSQSVKTTDHLPQANRAESAQPIAGPKARGRSPSQKGGSAAMTRARRSKAGKGTFSRTRKVSSSK